MEGVLTSKGRQCPGDVCPPVSGRGWGGAVVDTTAIDHCRSLDLDMWDGWKVVGDIGVDFKT